MRPLTKLQRRPAACALHGLPLPLPPCSPGAATPLRRQSVRPLPVVAASAEGAAESLPRNWHYHAVQYADGAAAIFNSAHEATLAVANAGERHVAAVREFASVGEAGKAMDEAEQWLAGRGVRSVYPPHATAPKTGAA